MAELAREREMLLLSWRKHLDLAQERVLPPSKTGSPRLPGGQGLSSEMRLGFELLSSPFISAGKMFQLPQPSFDTRNSSFQLNRQQAGN